MKCEGFEMIILQFAVDICSFNGVQRCNYLGGKPIRKIKVERRVRKHKKRKNAGKGEMVKGGGDMGVNWFRRLCNIAFESSFIPEDWRPAVTVPLYDGKNYRHNSLLNLAGKMHRNINKHSP